jgi:para-nitrobenzyl esterase
MGTYWTNFAKDGDPNGNGMPQWPAFSEKNPVLMYFATTPHVGPVPNDAGLRALDRYFAWRRSPEGAEAARREDATSAAAVRPGGVAAGR